MSQEDRTVIQRASAMQPTTHDDLYSVSAIARGAYRYDTGKTRTIRQGNKQVKIHYGEPPRKKHVLVPVGAGMIIMLAVIIIGNVIISVWGSWQADSKYGYPRTSQMDAVVGHGDSELSPTHFIFQNLQGKIYIIEISGGDPGHSHLYPGPILRGVGVDKIPVTATFNDENGDGKIDMVVEVDRQRIIYLNDGNEFKRQ